MRLPHRSRTALCMFAGYGLLTFDENFAQGRLADFRLAQERYSAPLYQLICIFEKPNGCARVLVRQRYIVCSLLIS